MNFYDIFMWCFYDVLEIQQNKKKEGKFPTQYDFIIIYMYMWVETFPACVYGPVNEKCLFSCRRYMMFKDMCLCL